ncbi:MAG: cytochrome c [Gammaproteobacteria bacterium]|nr:cytochrome c [Gammaproteobacteria bacterium]
MKAMLLALSVTLFFNVAHAEGDPAAGKKTAQQCASCHGPDGNSTSPTYPKLAGQHEDYLTQALHDYKSGARENSTMAGMAGPLSEQDIEDLAAYFSQQQGLSQPEID